MTKNNPTCNKCPVHISGGICRGCFIVTGMEIMQYYEWEQPPLLNRKGYGIALDIGTTTLAFELFDLEKGERLSAFSAVNSQRAYGADVITRINRATQGAAHALHTYIVNDIQNGVASLLSQVNIPADAVRYMAIAGNTTMLHLLHGLPCDTLGVYPFTPVVIGSQTTCFDFLPGCEVFTLPGVSAFVGADITAGLYCLGCTTKDETVLFIDLGTNGEMALVHKNRVFVASTAAGPAFEAGNISHGVASVKGAINSIRFDEKLNEFNWTTVQNAIPVGICGTGVLDITAELIRHKRISETGRLNDTYPDKKVNITPDIAFTQNDIREVQLAKSAVRTGIEILLESAGCNANDIKQIYLAGGFGYRLNPKNAETLGLLPPNMGDKIKTAGNTSLGGAAKVLLSADTEIEKIAAQATEINLAAHPRFNDLFMEYITFEGLG